MVTFTLPYLARVYSNYVITTFVLGWSLFHRLASWDYQASFVRFTATGEDIMTSFKLSISWWLVALLILAAFNEG